MSSACNSLERGLGSHSEIGAGLQPSKHRIIATRPVVTDKGPGPSALQKRTSMEMEESEASKVFYEQEGVQCAWTNTQADSEGESLSRVLMAV